MQFRVCISCSTCQHNCQHTSVYVSIRQRIRVRTSAVQGVHLMLNLHLVLKTCVYAMRRAVSAFVICTSKASKLSICERTNAV